MAIKAHHEFQGIEYAAAYYRIQKISIGISDVEYEIDHGDKITVGFKKNVETLAFAMIYADKDSRDNNVRPLNRIGFQFQYDLDSGKNILAVAYEALKQDLAQHATPVEDI